MHHPHVEEFSHAQLEFPIQKQVPIAPCPVFVCLWEEPCSIFSITTIQAVDDHYEDPPVVSSPGWESPVPSASLHMPCDAATSPPW